MVSLVHHCIRSKHVTLVRSYIMLRRMIEPGGPEPEHLFGLQSFKITAPKLVDILVATVFNCKVSEANKESLSGIRRPAGVSCGSVFLVVVLFV